MQRPRLTQKVADALHATSGHLQQEIQNDEINAQGLYELHDQVEIAVKYLDRLYQWHKQEKMTDDI
tara:strand:+ start:183 stop:380 length:198 start_codon:yes stop_codon:yes gene_type:complete